MMDYQLFVDEVNRRLENAIDIGGGETVWFTETPDEAEWRRDAYAVRLARYADGGVVVAMFYDGRRCGPGHSLILDDIGANSVVDIVLDHAGGRDRRVTTIR